MKMGTSLMLWPLLKQAAGSANPVREKGGEMLDTEMMNRLIAANDKHAGTLMDAIRPELLNFSRKTGYDFAVLAAAYCSKESSYYHNKLVGEKLGLLVDFLAAAQSDDGTVNIGNLESPPDTAFLLEILCPAAAILKKDNAPDLNAVQKKLKSVIVKAGEALSVGGVHTPNHRWVICAALAQINTLFPDKKYTRRIDEWMQEGIYMDKDGHYPERSGLYSGVENNSMLTMARLLDKPALLDPIRKNLGMMYYYMEPDGDLVTVDSRRQDQYIAKTHVSFYQYYRYMAIRDQNPFFAAIARQIEGADGFEDEVLKTSLYMFLENELLQKPLPTPNALPVHYERLFTTSHLLRLRRENTTATLFGGVDWPLIIASGRSCSPNFFMFRKGDAVLQYMRLSSDFFNTGYFYSDGLRKEGDQYILYRELEVPYYQPLPENKRKKDGDYKLSPSIDGRFWNKMDFEDRPVSNVKILETTVIFTATDGNIRLDCRVDGFEGVPVTIELCFEEGGNLAGVTNAGNDNYFLEQGMAAYTKGKDKIRFGPGKMAHKSISHLEGERYSTHFGSLRTTGMHVFITGKTPLQHSLIFS